MEGLMKAQYLSASSASRAETHREQILMRYYAI